MANKLPVKIKIPPLVRLNIFKLTGFENQGLTLLPMPAYMNMAQKSMINHVTARVKYCSNCGRSVLIKPGSNAAKNNKSLGLLIPTMKPLLNSEKEE